MRQNRLTRYKNHKEGKVLGAVDKCDYAYSTRSSHFPHVNPNGLLTVSIYKLQR